MDHLKRQRSSNGNTNTGVAVAYLKYNDPDLTVSSIMGSFFKQLLSDCEDIPEALVALHDSHEASNSPLPVDLIRDVGSAMVDKFQQLYFVLDGLDEATNEVRWDLIEKLRELEPHVHLLITSRYRDDIAEELDDFKRADIHADPSDIEKFIDHQIKKNRHLTRMVTKSPGIRAEIKHAVVKTAEGMSVSPDSPMFLS